MLRHGVGKKTIKFTTLLCVPIIRNSVVSEFNCDLLSVIQWNK